MLYKKLLFLINIYSAISFDLGTSLAFYHLATLGISWN